MIIKAKIDNKIKKVSVSSLYCPTYKCFSPHYYNHKSRSIDGKAKYWQNKELSCSHRDFHGCPDYPKRKEL